MENEAKEEKLLQMRLTDSEKGYLFQFAQNKEMVQAVEKALLYKVYQMGTVAKEDEELITINWAMNIANSSKTAEEKGQMLEVVSNAIALLKDSFSKIRTFGVEVVTPTVEKNPAMGE